MSWLVEYLRTFVSSNASAGFPEAGNVWAFDTSTYNAQSYKHSRGSPQEDSDVVIDWADPTVDVINALNEMLFRAAVNSSTRWNLTSLIDPGVSPLQSVVANQTVTRIVFHSNFRWKEHLCMCHDKVL